ncbi:hypothetical protein CLOM_g5036 [Closterium sp. NIES-68]|nr:hypothetical protein CLOM_g5036 [Closterium sp. NIES-68]
MPFRLPLRMALLSARPFSSLSPLSSTSSAFLSPNPVPLPAIYAPSALRDLDLRLPGLPAPPPLPPKHFPHSPNILPGFGLGELPETAVPGITIPARGSPLPLSAPPHPAFAPKIWAGGGPRTFPGGVTKWQWKRMQEKKRRARERGQLIREQEAFEAKRREQLRILRGPERPWEEESDRGWGNGPRDGPRKGSSEGRLPPPLAERSAGPPLPWEKRRGGDETARRWGQEEGGGGLWKGLGEEGGRGGMVVPWERQEGKAEGEADWRSERGDQRGRGDWGNQRGMAEGQGEGEEGGLPVPWEKVPQVPQRRWQQGGERPWGEERIKNAEADWGGQRDRREQRNGEGHVAGKARVDGRVRGPEATASSDAPWNPQAEPLAFPKAGTEAGREGQGGRGGERGAFKGSSRQARGGRGSLVLPPVPEEVLSRHIKAKHVEDLWNEDDGPLERDTGSVYSEYDTQPVTTPPGGASRTAGRSRGAKGSPGQGSSMGGRGGVVGSVGVGGREAYGWGMREEEEEEKRAFMQIPWLANSAAADGVGSNEGDCDSGGYGMGEKNRVHGRDDGDAGYGTTGDGSSGSSRSRSGSTSSSSLTSSSTSNSSTSGAWRRKRDVSASAIARGIATPMHLPMALPLSIPMGMIPAGGTAASASSSAASASHRPVLSRSPLLSLSSLLPRPMLNRPSPSFLALPPRSTSHLRPAVPSRGLLSVPFAMQRPSPPAAARAVCHAGAAGSASIVENTEGDGARGGNTESGDSGGRCGIEGRESQGREGSVAGVEACAFSSLCLTPALLSAIHSNLGFHRCTPLQAAVIPHILAGSDLLVMTTSPGAGKAMAYLLPCLDRLLSSLLDSPTRLLAGAGTPVEVLLVCATRARAERVLEQAQRVLELRRVQQSLPQSPLQSTQQMPQPPQLTQSQEGKWGVITMGRRRGGDRARRAERVKGKGAGVGGIGQQGVGAQMVVGGVNMDSEGRRLQQVPCQVLVATPGRLLDHLQHTQGMRNRVQELKVLVFEDLDCMVDMGFARTMLAIRPLLPTSRQTLLFTNTLSNEVVDLAQDMLNGDHKCIDCTGVGKETNKLSKRNE